MDKSDRWTTIYDRTKLYYQAIQNQGGHVDVIQLPDVGFKGNSHLMMLEHNNMEVADFIQKWLKNIGMTNEM